MADLSTTAGALMLWTAERLLTGSVQGAVIIGVVWLVCRRIASVPASIRAMLWWLASLKLVLALMPLPALPLALLPPQERVPTEIVHTASTAAALPAIVAPAVALRPASEMRTVSDRAAGAVDIIPWLAVVIVLWLAGIGVQAVQLLSSLRRLRRVAAESVALGTEDTVVARRIADGLGLRRIPEIRVSDEIDSPQVVGLRRPVMLLPSAVITTFTPNERAMTLCHELVHVRRHDLALGWVPALAERLFFFHPLARVAAREYVIAREAACDAAVLRALDVAPQEYGRLLVRFGVTRFVPGFSATGASSSTSSLRRRLDMLHHTTLSRASRRATWLLACVVALALLPFQLVARTSGEPAAVRAMVITPGNTGGADAGAAPRTAAADVTQERAPLPRASVEAFRWLNERLIELKKRAPRIRRCNSFRSSRMPWRSTIGRTRSSSSSDRPVPRWSGHKRTASPRRPRTGSSSRFSDRAPPSTRSRPFNPARSSRTARRSSRHSRQSCKSCRRRSWTAIQIFSRPEKTSRTSSRN